MSNLFARRSKKLVSVGKLEEELEKAKLVVEPIEGKILMLERKVADMSCELSRVGLKANDNEQYSRRYNVRIFWLCRRGR